MVSRLILFAAACVIAAAWLPTRAFADTEISVGFGFGTCATPPHRHRCAPAPVVVAPACAPHVVRVVRAAPRCAPAPRRVIVRRAHPYWYNPPYYYTRTQYYAYRHAHGVAYPARPGLRVGVGFGFRFGHGH